MTQNNLELFQSLLLSLQTKSCAVDLAPPNGQVIVYLATCNQVTFIAYMPFGEDTVTISRGVSKINSKDTPLAEEIFDLIVSQEEEKAAQKLAIGRIKNGDYGIPKFYQEPLQQEKEEGGRTQTDETDSGSGGKGTGEGNNSGTSSNSSSETGTDGVQNPTDPTNPGTETSSYLAQLMESLSKALPPLENEECPLNKTERNPNYTGRWALKVFNNEKASYDDIINILIEATQCTPEEAFTETWEIDQFGHAFVAFGSYEDLEKRAEIIEEFADTDIVPEWVED